MPISPLLRRIASNKHKHIVLKGGAIHYYGSHTTPLSHYKSHYGCGTVARHHNGGAIEPLSRQLSHLSVHHQAPPPQHFTRTKKHHSKPINFKF